MENQSSFLRTALIIGGGLAVVALLGGLIWWIIGQFQGTKQESTVEQIHLTTSDGVEIVGDIYRPNGTPRGAALMVHMLPATKASWQSFATELAGQGYLGLAIDLRGHGASTHQGNRTLNYQEFSDAEHQASQLDLNAALTYLQTTENFGDHQIGLVGASLGANLVVQALATHPQFTWGVVLSPGFDYRGIAIEPLMQQIRAPQRLLLVTSTDDLYSAQTVARLERISAVPITTTKIAGPSHGTAILSDSPETQTSIITWITSNTLKIDGGN